MGTRFKTLFSCLLCGLKKGEDREDKLNSLRHDETNDVHFKLLAASNKINNDNRKKIKEKLEQEKRDIHSVPFRRESFHQNSLRHQRPKLEPQENQNLEQNNNGPRKQS